MSAGLVEAAFFCATFQDQVVRACVSVLAVGVGLCLACSHFPQRRSEGARPATPRIATGEEGTAAFGQFLEDRKYSGTWC